MKHHRKISKVKLPTHKKRAQTKNTDGSSSDHEERLRAILESAVEGIITIDERGIMESVNPSAEKIFGYKATELIGKNVSVLMPSPHRDRHDDHIKSYLHTGRAKIIGIGREVSGRRKDGTIFPMDLSVSEVKLTNRQLFTGFIRDITERKELERRILEIGEREQRRIGHDLHDGLCQHLAGIELMSQALAQKLAKHSKNEAAQAGEIAKNVRNAISHTRLLARGLSPVTSESGGLVAALDQLAADTERIFNISCRFNCNPAVQVHDHAVATNFFFIAREAVTNAMTHGRASRISINLESTADQLLLCVADDGKGFATKFSGERGMGLPLMQSRVNLIGGALVVEETASAGVRVFCSVPKHNSCSSLARADGDKGKKRR